MGRAFVFPGSPQQYAGLVDVTDARLLAGRGSRHAGRHEQGIQHRQRRRLPLAQDVARIAGWFGLEAAPYPDAPRRCSSRA